MSLSVLVFSYCMPRSGIVGSCGSYILFFKDLLYCSPSWLYQFIFLPVVQEGSLHILSSIYCLFNDSHSDQCEVILHLLIVCFSGTELHEWLVYFGD